MPAALRLIAAQVNETVKNISPHTRKRHHRALRVSVESCGQDFRFDDAS